MSFKRKEIIGDCVLYLGDCMDIMPTLGKVDAVVDNNDAVVFNSGYEKSTNRKHTTKPTSGSGLGAKTRGYYGNVCERDSIAASNGGEVSGNANRIPASNCEDGYSTKIEGQGWEAKRTLQGRNTGNGLSQDDRKEALQSLRGNEPTCNTPQGQQSYEQHHRESGSSLLSLPQQPSQTRVVELPKGWAIVTDPPYGLGEKLSGGTWGSVLDKKGLKWDQKPQDVAFLLKYEIPTIIWGGNYFAVPPSRCWLIWNKPPGGLTFADCELAWTNFDKNSRVLTHQELRGFAGEPKLHETQKPISLMKWCIEQLPKDCDTILDPFMGSGTTLVACAKMGRKGIGIEIDEKYFDIACRRVEEAYSQPDLFIDPPVKAEQDSLF